MDEHIYPEPVSRLIKLGNPQDMPGAPDWMSGPKWPNYPAEYGLTTEHIAELIHMAVDDTLHNAETDSTEVFAPVHAWRALGQLRAAEAVKPLLGLFHRIDDDHDDWAQDELPEVMGMIGPATVAPVARYLADSKNLLWARITAANSLEKIGGAHSQSRQDCISALAAVLEKFASNDELLNGEIVSALATLDAVEAAPLVEQAYKADRVDESLIGDWEDFQIEVGLLEQRITDLDEDLDFNPFIPSFPGEIAKPYGRKEDSQTKKKRKQAKDSRKKNRKKKKK
jgi:hypothetical protein